MSRLPFRTRKKSSVSSCLCQVNSPFTFTTITSQSLKVVIVRGDQKSPKVASLSASDMPSAMCHPSLLPREARFGGDALGRQGLRLDGCGLVARRAVATQAVRPREVMCTSRHAQWCEIEPGGRETLCFGAKSRYMQQNGPETLDVVGRAGQ